MRLKDQKTPGPLSVNAEVFLGNDEEKSKPKTIPIVAAKGLEQASLQE